MKRKVVPLELVDVEAYVAHRIRQVQDSGKDGAPVTHFYAPAELPQPETLRVESTEGWVRPLSRTSWLRTWGAWVGEELVAHLELRGPRHEAALHRANLGMGVERRFQRAGIGAQLMEVALVWARAQPTIRWIDLGVFAHNQAAMRLYEKHHFVEWGRVDDAFRVRGERITAIHLSLDLELRKLSPSVASP